VTRVSTNPPLVESESVRVMFLQTVDEQEAITQVWAQLEAAVGSLRGRKFYGVFDPATGAYRACVQWREGDRADALRLHDGAIAGGRYVRERLEGDPPEIYLRIQPAFERLSRRLDRDPSRPEIEYYRRRDLIDLLLPVV